MAAVVSWMMVLNRLFLKTSNRVPLKSSKISLLLEPEQIEVS
jgi:hypothetical protein